MAVNRHYDLMIHAGGAQLKVIIIIVTLLYKPRLNQIKCKTKNHEKYKENTKGGQNNRLSGSKQEES